LKNKKGKKKTPYCLTVIDGQRPFFFGPIQRSPEREGPRGGMGISSDFFANKIPIPPPNPPFLMTVDH